MKHVRTVLLIFVVALFAGSVFAEDAVPSFDDGRLNDYDLNAPVAVFTVDYGDELGLDLWAPVGFENWGELILRVTPEEIAAVSSTPDETTLIASSAEYGVSLYRLTDGSFQILADAGDSGTYSLVFSEMINHAGYTSEWLKA